MRANYKSKTLGPRAAPWKYLQAKYSRRRGRQQATSLRWPDDLALVLEHGGLLEADEVAVRPVLHVDRLLDAEVLDAQYIGRHRRVHCLHLELVWREHLPLLDDLPGSRR